MTRTVIILALTALYAAPAGAEEFSSEGLTERALHRRAVEAVIWGMPAVNYERMLQAAITNGAKANQIVYWSRPANWQTQTLTPNPDTIYLNPFYDTTAGSVVLEIPAAEGGNVIVGSVDDAWQNALEDSTSWQLATRLGARSTERRTTA